MKQETQTLGEVLKSFDSTRVPIKSSERLPGKTPYLGASGVVDHVDGFTHEGSYLCVSEDGANLLTRSLPIAWVQEGQFWANNHLHVLGGVSRDHLKFFQYAIEQTNIAAYISGSAQPKLTQQALSTVRVPRFGAEGETAIGKLLAALDDKIAANNQVLSAASKLLLTKYDSITKFDSELVLGEIAQVFGGSTPSTKVEEYWDGDIRWATPTDITALNGPWISETARTITDAGLKSMSSGIHPENSILMTSRATIGAIALAAKPIATNQGFIVVEASDELTPWLYAQMIDRQHEFESWANGATFMELSRGNFKKLPFYSCDDTALAEFNTFAWPLLDRMKAAQAENEILARTRNELLPLLMSGRITVAEASESGMGNGVEGMLEGMS